MRFPLKLLLQSVGVSSILLVMNYGDLLGGGGDVRMHVPFPIPGMVLAQITDILLLGIVLFAIFWALQRKGISRIGPLVIAIALPPFILKRVQALLPAALREHVSVIALVWLVVLVLLFYKFPAVYQRLLKAGDAIAVCFAIFAFASIAQLVWIVRWAPGTQQQQPTWASQGQPARQHPLLVWIVFDELSYDQVFEHRAQGLALPAFDALRSQSILFTNVQPAGIKTVEVIPSLLGGNEVDNTRFTLANHLVVHGRKASEWKPFRGDDTLFHTAQQAGWRTAAVGWYNPYCTIYSGAIDDCYWNNLDQTDGPMSPRASYVANTLSPLRQLAEQAVMPRKAGFDACSYDVEHRYQTAVDLEAHAVELLKTDQADFVFLHLPIPHSPNIWNRATNSYRSECGGSYVDNLALADHVLGQFMQLLQASPRWKETSVIVEGDHSWRVKLWDWLPAWTAEDRAVSHDVFDTRPALLVHLPGQKDASTNATAWPLLRVHDVVGNILQAKPAGL